ncbi:Lrp/AsnC family transcriptional regulator [Streptomyces sp. PSKA28]|uniref:Lrp/AsnC family transcriptional regulator n=1 Tax=Streptomyces himalayensis subsp. himalayensis TaxID=2756131 RepID=A0A7W0I9M2_9ACTN|nr:Lrp/AsnC family transcriptional regulator [Streptomyces himalayensis subsp. himalayensis]
MAHQPLSLDDLDRKILSALVANARTSFVEIGHDIGLSPAAVKRRVDRMREAEIITGFTTLVRPSVLGWRTEAYVEVYCDSAAPPRRLAEVARTYPEVVAAMTVTGDADALLHIRAADIEHFEEVLERIRAESFVQRTNSVIVLSHLLPGSPEAASTEPSADVSAALSGGASARPSDVASAKPSDAASAKPTSAANEPSGRGAAEPSGRGPAEPPGEKNRR